MVGLKKKAAFLNKFSVRLFLLIVIAAIIPLSLSSVYIARHMENALRDSLNHHAVENIRRGEENLSQTLQDLAFYSNIFVYDTRLRSMLAEENTDSFDLTKYFDEIVARSQIENPSGVRADAKIVIIDQFGRCLTNWSLNFNDYRFLLKEDWVKESMTNDGHIIWSLFSPAYIEGENGRYISLARSILTEVTSGEYLGTLIISIEQSQFEDILRAFASPEDSVYILLDDGSIVFESAPGSVSVQEEDLLSIQSEYAGTPQGSKVIKIDGRRCLLSYYTLPSPWLFNGSTLKVFHFCDYSPIEAEVKSATDLLWLAIIGSAAVVLAVSFLLSRKVVTPITTLTRQLTNYQIGMHFEGLLLKRRDEIGDLDRGIARMDARIKRLFRSLKAEHEQRERYYYESLRAQLNPHYIYNTLSTIRWMAIARGADNIVEAIDNLSTTLKYSMGKQDIVLVSDEISHIRSYIEIHNLRYDEYVELSIEIDDEIMSMQMMKFILQPVVENSILHGFDKSRGLIDISISAEVRDDRLMITILDDGVGIKKDAVDAFNSRIGKGRKLTGIGLRNVDESIKGRFGRMYGLSVSPREDTHGTKTVFTLPLLKGGELPEADGSSDTV